MRWWEPEPGQDQLLDWWRPLLAAARRARDDAVPWPIHLDEFDLVARADRHPRPAIWVYRHRVSGGALCADATGRTYLFRPSPARPGTGRFSEIAVRHAVWQARLPHVVTGIRYEYDDEPEDEPAALDVDPEPAVVVRRGHLGLVAGTGR